MKNDTSLFSLRNIKILTNMQKNFFEILVQTALTVGLFWTILKLTPKSALLSFTILYLDLIEFSICRLLRGLAIFDGLFLLAAILSFGLPTLSTWFNDVVFMRIMATLFGLLHTFRTGSVYITLGVTFERFYSIVCPLRHNRYVIKMPK